MTGEKRGQASGRVRDALDLCLFRIAQGERPEQCLADFPELAADLRPLLDAAVVIRQDLGAPAPAPAGGLAGGRARLLAAAETARIATATAVREDSAAAEALDLALARLMNGSVQGNGAAGRRNGSSGNATPSPSPLAASTPIEIEFSESDSLASLLATANALRQNAQPSPTAPGALAAGRERMLAIAAALVAAEAPIEDAEFAAAESLDRALAAAWAAERAGLRSASGAEASAADVGQSALIGLAERIRSEAAAAVPAPQDLLPGRARFLEVAARTAKHRGLVTDGRAQASTSALPALAWLGQRLPFGSARAGLMQLATASLAAVLLFFGGVRALETEAASSLPGDALYTIKRINEGMDLMIYAFDTEASARLRNEQAKLRATEIDQALVLGRLVESKVVGGLLGYGRTGNDPDAARGKVSVRVPAEGDDAEVHSYGWDEKTRISPGAWGKMSAVPRGSRVELRIVSERTLDGYARAISLKVLDQPAQPMTVTATITFTPTITPTGSAAVPITPTAATPTARASASPTVVATSTPLPSPTVATPTLAPSATVVVAETVEAEEPPRAKPALNRYSGWVVAQPRPELWRIEEDLSHEINDFDLSLLGDSDRAGIKVGDAVRVEYRKGTNPRVVESITLLAKQRCIEGLQMGGTVASVENGRLRLNSGAEFGLPESIQGRVKLEPGAEVEIQYRDCGGRLELIDLRLITPEPNRVSVEGLIDRIEDLGNGRLRLHLDSGEQIEVGPSTSIRPGGSTLRSGQFIMVEGEQQESGLILARRIDILDGGDAAAPPGDGDEPPTRATAGPSPSAVPSPTSLSVD